MSERNIIQEYNTVVKIKREIEEPSAALYQHEQANQKSVKREREGERDKMYLGHEVKEEMVVGPVVLQKPGPYARQGGNFSETDTRKKCLSIAARLREQNQAAPMHRVLLPDAPPRKRRAQRPSPERQPCEFVRAEQPGDVAAPETGDVTAPELESEVIKVDDKDFDISIGDYLRDLHTASDDEDLIVDDPKLPALTARDQPADDAGLSSAEVLILRREEEASDRLLRALAPSQDYFDFTWTSQKETFTGKREVFTGSPGPTFPVTNETRAVDIFYKMFDEDFLDMLVTETNRYAEQQLTEIRRSRSSKKGARDYGWTPTNRDEMLAFLAFIILQGLYPKVTEESYFSFDGFGTTPYFSSIMSYNRYHLLKKFLHFVDNTTNTDETRLDKIRPVIDYFNGKFSQLYMPAQEIAIDESLLRYHGRLSFSQKISSKAAKVGVKTYELCESSSGYLWSFIVYTGKDRAARTNRTKRDGADQLNGQEGRLDDGQEDVLAMPTDGRVQNDHNDRADDRPRKSVDDRQEAPDNGQDCGSGNVRPINATAKIVYELVEPLLHKGHTLIMDNFYNSPLLARCLKRDGQTDVYGTLRLSREFVPNAIKSITNTDMRQGEAVVSYTSDLAVMLWRNANLVSMISTYHPLQIGTTEKHNRQTFKPAIVLDYNKHMGGVDRKDQFLAAQPLERQKIKSWYKKLFRRLYNVAVFNCFCIYRSKNRTAVHRQFRIRLAEDLIKIHRNVDLTLEPRLKLTRKKNTETRTEALLVPRRALPYVEVNHFPKRASSSNVRCKMCSLNKVSKRTTYMCEECGVNLCVVPCFKDYHKLGALT